MQMKERKDAIADAYNGMAMPAALTETAVIATTEKVAVQDPFFADNMRRARALGVKNVFIYGDRFTTPEKAQSFIRACGYEDAADIVFINKKDLSYEDMIGRVVSEAGKAGWGEVNAANIGIRAAAGEMGVPSGESKFLEVQPYTTEGGKVVTMKDGTEVLLTMNTYQVLLAIIGKSQEGIAAAERIGIPGLSFDGKKYIYLPPAEPRDIAADYEAYKSMIELVSSAA